MNRFRLVGRIVAATILLSSGSAIAVPSGGQQTTPFNGSSFTSACVGHNFQGFGFGENLGRDMSTFGVLNATNGPANCSAATSSGVGSVSSSAADGGPIGNLGGSFNGASSGTAEAGIVKLQAQNTAVSTQRFTGAAANGGWNDSYTPGGGTGTALWVIPIQVTGTVNAQAPGTTAIFQLMPYVNTSSISSSPAHHAAALAHYATINTLQNGDVISAWSFEMSAWGVMNHGGTDPLVQLAVNETVDLVIPITYGQAVDLGIFASVLVGERAQNAATGFADAQFQNTVTWLGKGYVLDWDSQNGIGAQNNNFTVSAASGLDYSQSFASTSVSGPVSWSIALSGLVLIAGMRRYQRSRP